MVTSPLEERGNAILRRLPAPACAVEVGVLRGALLHHLLMHHDTLTLVMVDNWLTAELQPPDYRATRDEHALHADADRVMAHRQDALFVAGRHGSRAAIAEGASVMVAARFPDQTFDMVFLDADHSESGVRADIEAWLPKVKPGGWIGGHDLDNDNPRFDFSGVRRAVEAWCPHFERDANYTWFARV